VQVGHPVLQERLMARYHFSVMMMMRSWWRPWTPSSHASYSKGFQDAVYTMFLVTTTTNNTTSPQSPQPQSQSSRIVLPSVLTHAIVSYLHRDWWPHDNDARKQCWSEECQLNSIFRNLRLKMLVQTPSAERHYGNAMAKQTQGGIISGKGASSSSLFKPCRKCQFAYYCSKDCRKSLNKAGHSKLCGKPPCVGTIDASFKKLLHRLTHDEGKKEGNEAITRIAAEDGDEGVDKEEEVLDDDGNESDWESVATEEEATNGDNIDDAPTGPSLTDVVYSYFESHSYKDLQMEEPAFARFYAD
jgi:hypothetical protein